MRGQCSWKAAVNYDDSKVWNNKHIMHKFITVFSRGSRQTVRFPHAKHSTSTCWDVCKADIWDDQWVKPGIELRFPSLSFRCTPLPRVRGDRLTTVQYETEEWKLLEGGGENCIPCGTDPEQDCRSTKVFSSRPGLKTCIVFHMEGRTMRPSCPRQQNT